MSNMLKRFRRKVRETRSGSASPVASSSPRLDTQVPEMPLPSPSPRPPEIQASLRPSISVVTTLPSNPALLCPPSATSPSSYTNQHEIPSENPSPISTQDSSCMSIFEHSLSPQSATPPTSVHMSRYDPRPAPNTQDTWAPPTSWRIDNVDEDELDSESDWTAEDAALLNGDNLPEIDVSGTLERCSASRGKAAQLSAHLGRLANQSDIQRLYRDCQETRQEIVAQLREVTGDTKGGNSKQIAASFQHRSKLEQVRQELHDAERELQEVTQVYESLLRHDATNNSRSALVAVPAAIGAGPPDPPQEQPVPPHHPLVQPVDDLYQQDYPAFAYTADWKPIALTDLMDQACERLWDTTTTLLDYLGMARSAEEQARILALNQQPTATFVQYAKAMTIVLQCIPSLENYATRLTQEQRRNLSEHGERFLDIVVGVGRVIFRRNEDWRNQRTVRTDFWPSAPESEDCAFPWLLFAVVADSRLADPINAVSKFIRPQVLREARNLSAILNLQGKIAQAVLDGLQKWLDHDETHLYRRYAISLLVRLATRSGKLPTSLFVRGVDIGESRDPWAYGGLADIFRASLNGGEVAVKRLRVNERGTVRAEIHKSLCKEALVWHQLRHPNVLTLLGIDATTFAQTDALCMVSPWMHRGTIMEYIVTNDYNVTTDRDGLLLDIAEGLGYLHSQNIVHGDLHGSNIFVTDDRRACLADFGLTVVGDVTLGRMTTTTHNNRGATRWLSPELLTDEEGGQKSPASDVYGFGLLCLATSTKTLPWHPLKDPAVLLALMSGKHPPRPSSDQCHGHPMSPRLWALAQRCWTHDPALRPKMLDVCATMRRWPGPRRQDTIRPLVQPAGPQAVRDARTLPETPVAGPSMNRRSTSMAQAGPSSPREWPWDKKEPEPPSDGTRAPRPTPQASQRQPASARLSQSAPRTRTSEEPVEIERLADLVARRLSVAEQRQSQMVDVDRIVELIAQRMDRGQASPRRADEPPPSYEGFTDGALPSPRETVEWSAYAGVPE